MLTQDDFSVSKGIADNEFLRFDSLYTQYTEFSRSNQDLQKMKKDLESEIGKTKSQKTDSELKAESYNRVFLDSRPDLGDPFYPKKIKTLQDFTLFFFALSYFLLVIAVSMAIYYQTHNMKKVAYTVFGSLLLGFIVFFCIYRYA